jgi:hypothetical protein
MERVGRVCDEMRVRRPEGRWVVWRVTMFIVKSGPFWVADQLFPEQQARLRKAAEIDWREANPARADWQESGRRRTYPKSH